LKRVKYQLDTYSADVSFSRSAAFSGKFYVIELSYVIPELLMPHQCIGYPM
jgi:hypothetical protein